MFSLLVLNSNFSYNKWKILFWHSSNDFRRSSWIPSIRKLFLLDLSSKSTNFLRISNANVGSVICITPTSSFVELSSFSRFCTFSFMVKNLWSICFWVKLGLSLKSSTSVFTKVRLSHYWSSLPFSNAWCPDIRSNTDFSCFVNIPSCLVSCSCNISLKTYLISLIVTIFIYKTIANLLVFTKFQEIIKNVIEEAVNHICH